MSWPDLHRSYSCTLHNVPLRVELGQNGRLDGEWFCRDFEDDGRRMAADRPGIAEFESIKNLLEPQKLYRCDPGQSHLKEVSFETLDEFK